MTRRRLFLILAALNAVPALLLTGTGRWASAACTVACLLFAANARPSNGGRR